MNRNPPPEDPLYQLGLALLEVIDKPVTLELEHPRHLAALTLQGILIRAFDTPITPSVSLMIGSQTLTLRLSKIKQTHIARDTKGRHQLEAIHLLLNDNYALHIKPDNQNITH
jgi:hypothetical protein